MPQMFPIYWMVIMVLISVSLLSIVFMLNDVFYLWEADILGSRKRESDEWL